MGSIEPLAEAAVKEKLGQMPSEEKVLEFLARYPIFLRYLHDDALLTNDIPTEQSRLFEELAPRDKPGRDENLRSLGKIAKAMLRKRQDFLKPKDFDREVAGGRIKEDPLFRPCPLQTLLRERNGDVRFLHHTIREFVLAWNFHSSLTSRTRSTGWDLLVAQADLDYEGAEVHRAVSELAPKPNWTNVKQKWGHLESWDAKNNFAWCYFESAGMLGVSGKDREAMLGWISEALSGKLDGHDGTYSFKTKYNAARCLERLHPSAPPCYLNYAQIHFASVAAFVAGWRSS